MRKKVTFGETENTPMDFSEDNEENETETHEEQHFMPVSTKRERSGRPVCPPEILAHEHQSMCVSKASENKFEDLLDEYDEEDYDDHMNYYASNVTKEIACAGARLGLAFSTVAS